MISTQYSRASSRVLIVGASGFVGANCADAARRKYEAVLHGGSHSPSGWGDSAIMLDLRVPGAGMELVSKAEPSLVVNCAALASVDGCEADPSLAHRLNVELPGELAEAASRNDASFVHISTDAVFGQASGVRTVDDEPAPINEYGRTKVAGEMAVLENEPAALVVRTNVVGWSPTGNRGLLEFFVGRLREGRSTPGFVDSRFRPIGAHLVFDACLRLVQAQYRGIVHLTASQSLSKYELGVAVARTFGLDPSLVQPAHIGDAGLVAPRPNLDVAPSVTESTVGISLDVGSTLDELRVLEVEGYRHRLAALKGDA